MSIKVIIGCIVISLLLCSNTFADRQLNKTEINLLFQELTKNPRTTWIKSGTIEAVQEEYRAPKVTEEQKIVNAIKNSIEEYQNDSDKAELSDNLQKMTLEAMPFNVRYHLSNEYTMKNTILIKYDGKRYYYNITVDSRKDSVQVPDELKTNLRTEQFRMEWHSMRISSFDGTRQTSYNPVINHATIDLTNITPGGIIAPLSSGLIPWGYGNFTYEKLTQIKSSAVEKSVDGHTQIELTLTNSDGLQSQIVLDAEKAYSPLSWVNNERNDIIAHQYGGYKLVSGSWVPTSIVIEKLDSKTNKLIDGDYINITNISGEVPSSADFNVDINPNTLVEYYYDITKPPLVYYSSYTANTDLLLAERMTYIASEGEYPQNCATASLQYAALQLGKDILDDKLSQLVNPDDGTTNLQDMKKYAENLGFYCKTVTTDIETLKNLSGCKAILHFPGTNHFVLLDHIDQKYVWLIDLTKNKFYYRSDINFFDLSWTEGTAMLISSKPIVLPDSAIEIPVDQLEGYTGATGWSCTYKIQSFRVINCIFDGESCYGLFQVLYPRWGCEPAASGDCPDDIYLFKLTFPCFISPDNPDTCKYLQSGRMDYYILACD
jgi:hypothetical protein